jgi:hypothetical protein
MRKTAAKGLTFSVFIFREELNAEADAVHYAVVLVPGNP